MASMNAVLPEGKQSVHPACVLVGLQDGRMESGLSCWMAVLAACIHDGIHEECMA
jgi:hypothetical protein